MTLLIGDVAGGREAWQRHQHARGAVELTAARAPRITWLGSALVLVQESAERLDAVAAITKGTSRAPAPSTADLATLMSARLGCTRADAAQLAAALEERCVQQWLSASPPDRLSELTRQIVRSEHSVLPAVSIVPAVDELLTVIAESVALACEAPAIEVAVHLTHDSFVQLSRTASTREMALALEGSIHVEPQAFQAASAHSAAAHPSPSPSQTDDPVQPGDARSAAEAFLFQMLESRASTASRFVLNERVDVLGVIPSYEVDLCDRVARIAIEIDGYHHFTDPEAYRRDRRKDLALQRSGYIILRFHAEDVVERLESILATIEQVLSERSPLRCND